MIVYFMGVTNKEEMQFDVLLILKEFDLTFWGVVCNGISFLLFIHL